MAVVSVNAHFAVLAGLERDVVGEYDGSELECGNHNLVED